MRPLIGDTVRIADAHHGFAKGQAGKVWGFTPDGRAVVTIRGGFRARVKIDNLVPLLDVYGKEVKHAYNRD